MGITLTCKKTKTSLDMGYGGFFNLRCKVAELHSKEWGEHYKTIDQLYGIGLENKDKAIEEWDKKTQEILDAKKANVKVIDFCLQSDCGGSIRYGACKIIYDAIKDYDDDFLYGYVGKTDCVKFADFKALIKECYDNKSDLVWY